jgi:glycosyltransferase involved in cell wall biosynthesis
MTDSLSVVRVAFVTNVIPDYRYPVFKTLLDSGRYILRIFVSESVDQSCQRARDSLPMTSSRGFSMRKTTWHSDTQTSQIEPLPIPIGVLKDLLVFRPDVVIAGDMGPRSFICWLSSRLCGARFVLWSEEIATSAVGRSRVQHVLRRFLVKRADAFLAWGAPAADYLKSIGADSRRIYVCAQAIDNDRWMARAQQLDRDAERESLSLKGTVFLLVGRLLPLKGMIKFLQAWSSLSPDLQRNSYAVIAGDGELMPELARIIRERGLTNVRLAGQCSPELLARYYSAADLFVFPSQVDVWGLVVNEALCFGLPVLASRYAGASQALIHGSKLGQVFDPLNPTEFADYLSAWANAPPARSALAGQAALSTVSFATSVQAIELMLSQVNRPTLPPLQSKSCAQTQNP